MARATPGSATSCFAYTTHDSQQGMIESCSVSFVLQSATLWAGTAISSDDDNASAALSRPFSALRVGTPLYTETKSQYSSPTEAMFHRASAMAEACADTKLKTRPEKTGASSLQLRSIRRITELIPVSTDGGCPHEMTTTLQQCLLTVPAFSLTSISMLPSDKGSC